jgi:hypothetical protein
MSLVCRLLVLFVGLAACLGCNRDGDKGKNSEKDRPTPADVKKAK